MNHGCNGTCLSLTRVVSVADSIALHRAKHHTYQMATTRDDELSNLTLNTKSLSLVCPTSLPFGVTYHAHMLTQSCMQVECSKPLWSVRSPCGGMLCPSVGPSGGPILEDVNFAVQAALPLLRQVLDEASWAELQGHLQSCLAPCRMMFINELNAATSNMVGGAVVPHIDTLASFGTVVVLLSETDASDQLTLYNVSIEKAVAAPTKNQVTTKNLHTPGQAVAFPCAIPHAVLGGRHRKSPRYSLNIFF